MKGKIIILLAGFFILGLVIGFFANKISLTGNVVKEESNYTWTKAICNSNNQCVDVLISCENGNVANLTLMSGIVDSDLNWTDFRMGSQTLCR